jgi:cation diffusion facilitator CzcD-associated flavoprotein CzcO
MDPPHPWGAKRPSLEQNYYEVFNLPHVDLIDLQEDPIEECTETGIRTRTGFKEFDVIALATGFDSVTGPLAQLDIRDTKGNTIADHWKDGLRTAIGISLAGFPNMFYLYGPQAPTAFANGPTCVQLQARWIEKTISSLIEKDIKRIEAKAEKEVEWTQATHQVWYASLFPQAKSWYQGKPKILMDLPYIS